MKRQIIPQNTTIEPVAETHYRCPVEGCRRLLEGMSHEEARAHAYQEVGYELPLGLVLKEKTGFSVINQSSRDFAKNVGNSGYLGLNHALLYLSHQFRLPLGGLGDSLFDVMMQAYYLEVNSKRVVDSLLHNGEYSLLSSSEFDDVLAKIGVENFSDWWQVTPVRTTPQLEEMLARMKTEKK